MITDKMVEAACVAMYSERIWNRLSEPNRTGQRESMLAALQAAEDAREATTEESSGVAPEFPAPDDDEPELLRTLDSFGEAYGEDMFPPLTRAERDELAGRGIIDRISAGMGRHLAKFIAQAAAEIRRLRASPHRSGGAPVAVRVRYPWSPDWHYAAMAIAKTPAELATILRIHADAGNVAELLYAAPVSDPADARDGGPKHGDDAGDGLRYVLCKVGFGTHYGNWLLIPHADGQYVTAAKLEPFSMSILRHQLAAIDSAMGAEGGDQ